MAVTMMVTVFYLQVEAASSFVLLDCIVSHPIRVIFSVKRAFFLPLENSPCKS
jgi:hypothetical protein